jgi:hypothetical protein
MKSQATGVLLALVLYGCSSGGFAPTPIAAVQSPQTTPTIPPASNVPTPAPSPAAAQRAVGAAPAGIVTSSSIRSSLASVPNAIPKIITSFSINPNWGGISGSFFAWVYSTKTGQTVPTSSVTLTLDPALQLAGPPTLDTTGRFGLSNDWSTILNPPSKAGILNIGAQFSDGTSGTILAYSYNTWFVTCIGGSNPVANVYQGAAPIPSTIASADVYLDCSAGNLVFPHGAVIASPPVADATGNVLTTITGVLALTSVPTTTTAFSLSTLPNGVVIVARTGDGGFGKFQPDHSSTSPLLVAGESLRDVPTGSGNYAL